MSKAASPTGVTIGRYDSGRSKDPLVKDQMGPAVVPAAFVAVTCHQYVVRGASGPEPQPLSPLCWQVSPAGGEAVPMRTS
jgi:hypothetical protein